MNIALPRRYGLVIERWQIYVFKGPDWLFTNNPVAEDGDENIKLIFAATDTKMNWFMLGIHISGWLPRIRYENIKEF